MIPFYLIELKNVPVFKQLQLEEALLRLDERNICLINEGSSAAIVMGISGKLEELVDLKSHRQNPLPIIRRFSGGGTVVVDEDTLFVTFLCQKQSHAFAPYPEPIMRWTEGLYKEIFGLENFSLKENDYVIDDLKCGGNAQYVRKERWLHHTTFLWDYKRAYMDLLLHPKKAPPYRMGREHAVFLTALKKHLPSKAHFIHRLKETLAKHYQIKQINAHELESLLKVPHRKTTTLLEDLEGPSFYKK